MNWKIEKAVINLRAQLIVLICFLILVVGCQKNEDTGVMTMTEITKVNEFAPAKASSQIKIVASADTIWSILTDFDNWKSWNRDIDDLTIDGDVAKGTVFKWKSGSAKITSIIQHVEQPHVISWTGKMMGINAIHVWEIIPDSSGALVRTSESWEGFIVKIFKKKMQKMLQEALDTGLQYLKAEAEKRTQS